MSPPLPHDYEVVPTESPIRENMTAVEERVLAQQVLAKHWTQYVEKMDREWGVTTFFFGGAARHMSPDQDPGTDCAL